MNIKLFLTAAVALTVGLTACNKEESLSQDGLPVNAVRITASVGNPFATTRTNPVGTAEMQGKFNSGDKILVVKVSDEEGVVYEFNGSTWAPAENKPHLWASVSESFEANYPLDEDGDAESSVKKDQSTLENLAMSDIMFAEIQNATKADVLNFVMKRQTSRIIINIAGFNPEFPANSVVKDVRVLGGWYSEIDPYYIPYQLGDGDKNSTYTLLLNPNESSYSSGFIDYYISLKVGEKEMRSANLPDTEKGKSYTFNLIVGKENLEIGSVTVEDWTTKDVLIPGGEAEQLT